MMTHTQESFLKLTDEEAIDHLTRTLPFHVLQDNSETSLEEARRILGVSEDADEEIIRKKRVTLIKTYVQAGDIENRDKVSQAYNLLTNKTSGKISDDIKIQIANNVFALIKAGCLNYDDLEKDEFKSSILWDVVFSDSSFTQLLCEKKLDLLRKFKTFNDNILRGRESFTPALLTSLWVQAADTEQGVKVYEEGPQQADQLFLFLLSTCNSGSTHENFHTWFLTRPSEACIKCGMDVVAAKWMFDAILQYRQRTEAEGQEKAFNSLLEELHAISEIVLTDKTGLLSLMSNNIIKPLEAKAQALSGKTDEVSKTKVEQLHFVIDEVKSNLAVEINQWRVENQQNPLVLEMKKTNRDYSTPLRENLASKVEHQYQSAIGTLKKYEAKKEIGKNANTIAPILKLIGSAAATACTFGIAALVSQRVRDGLMRRPDTQKVLRSCREDASHEMERIHAKMMKT